MDENYVVRCPSCGTKNRIPARRWGGKAVCGRCGNALETSRLYPDRAVSVSDWNFEAEVSNFSGAVLVAFSASW